MASSATVTAKIGPAVQATAVVLSDIRGFTFNCDGNNLGVQKRDGSWVYFGSYSTITVTVSSGNYTLTVS